MRRIRTINSKKPPKGFDVIEPKLNEFTEKLRDIESESSEGKKKSESIWPIMKIHHQISRYIFQCFRNKEINREVYEYCLNEKIADAKLIAKWKKKGYEKLCCLMCIQNSNHNFGTTCICRVPKSQLEGKKIECIHCGCGGCASCDV